MKIHFWSSTEYSGFLESLTRELKEHGFNARQRYQISEVSYRAAKSPLARLWLRVRQYLIYPVQVLVSLLWDRLRGRNADVCVVNTNTFYVPLLATYLHPNVVHLLYDLFPEALIHAGKWREDSCKVECVRWITKKTLQRAKVNVFLGQRLKDYVESIHGVVDHSVIIEVGAPKALFGNMESMRTAERLKAEGNEGMSIKTLYSGNFGHLHDSATLFRFWKEGAEGMNSEEGGMKEVFFKLEWLFYCSGPKRNDLIQLREQLPDTLKKQIVVGEGLPQEAWIKTMESVDIALVTMAPGSETVVMPSKTYSAMMAGQAILAIAPEASDLVDLIKVADCGWWVEPGDSEGLEQTLKLICSDTDKLLEKCENAYNYAHEHLGQDSLAKKWIELFEGFQSLLEVHSSEQK